MKLNLELFNWHEFVKSVESANKEVDACGSKESFSLLCDILSEKEKETLMVFCNFLFEHVGETLEVVELSAKSAEEAIAKAKAELARRNSKKGNN